MPEGTIDGEPYKVPEGYRVVTDRQARSGTAALALLMDLDRSPNGRHEGDVESQDPTGVSQGNDRLRPGSTSVTRSTVIRSSFPASTGWATPMRGSRPVRSAGQPASPMGVSLDE